MVEAGKVTPCHLFFPIDEKNRGELDEKIAKLPNHGSYCNCRFRGVTGIGASRSS
jgi:hypothetical protein